MKEDEDILFAGSTPKGFGLKVFIANIKIEGEEKELSIPAGDKKQALQILFNYRTKGIENEKIEVISIEEE